MRLQVVMIFGLLVSLFIQPPLVLAEGDARLYLQQIPLQDEKLLVVNVLVEDVTNLYGAELRLRYNPQQLQVRDEDSRLDGVQIAPGPLLGYEDRFVAQNLVDPEAGLVNLAMTLLNPAPPVSGAGVLAVVVFEIMAPGPFTIEVAEAILVSPAAEALPVKTEDLYTNGHTLAPQFETTPVFERWLWWGGGSLFLGGVLLWLMWQRRRWTAMPQNVSVSTSGSSARMPGGRLSPLRSAALLTEQANFKLNLGELETAYHLFSQAIELDTTNLDAWLGKGLVAQNTSEKRICFERVLALDPENVTAKIGLQEL